MDLTMADVRQLTDGLEEPSTCSMARKPSIDRPSTGILFNVASYVCRACSRVGKGAVAFWKRFGITLVFFECGKVQLIFCVCPVPVFTYYFHLFFLG